MPSIVKKYSIFLGSPSDLAPERDSIKEVIDELNITYGIHKNIVFELEKWETNSAPGVGEVYPQQVITRDIGDSYDIFLGLLWTRFGTPTPAAGSGTEEEFNDAYHRFKETGKFPQILIYFKTSVPDSLDKIDPIELQKVKEFKSSLGNLGLLYWEFRESGELKGFLRVHITKRVEELEKLDNNNASFASPRISGPDLDELGIIDYEETIEDAFGDAQHALNEITEAIIWVGQKIDEKTTEINALNGRKEHLSLKERRKYFHRTATVLNDFAKRLEPLIPIFFDNFELGVNSLSNVINLTSDADSTLIGAYEMTKVLVGIIEETIEKMAGFLDSVSKLPRLEKELNKSRRNVEERLSELIEKLNISSSLSKELKKQFEQKYGFH